jgi:dynactin complex subunit
MNSIGSVDATWVGAIAGAVAAVIGGLTVYWKQKATNRSILETNVLNTSGAASQLAVAALDQWREIVTAQSKIQAQQVVDISELRNRVDELTIINRTQMAAIAHLTDQLREVTQQLAELRSSTS